MKNTILYIFATILLLASQTVIAGSITDTYSSGDTLTAAKMDNIKAAVNDNNVNKQARVTGTCPTGQSIRVINANGTVTCENNANKQDRVTGTCPTGQSIRVINSNGTVTCEVDSNTTYSAGSGISISGTTISTIPTPSRYTYFAMLNKSSASNVGTTYVKIEDVGSVYKSSSSTSIEAQLHSFISITPLLVYTPTVYIQLRLNNNAPSIGGVVEVKPGHYQDYYSLVGVFRGLSAGTYTLSIWTKATSGVASSVLVDSGGYGGNILLKETL